MVQHFLDMLPLWALGIVATGSCILFGVAVSHVAHRAGWTLRRDDLDSATVLHALVSLVYSVALGLIVINAQEDHTEVRRATVDEAAALGDLYRDAQGIELTSREQLRADLRAYVDIVIDQEWPALRSGEPARHGEELFDRMSVAVLGLQPGTEAGLVVQRALVDNLRAAADARRTRVFLGAEGLNRGTWAVVLIGAMVALGFAALFPVEARHRRIVIAFTGAMFGLMLFLLAATSPPLRGQMGVGPGAFEELRVELDQG